MSDTQLDFDSAARQIGPWGASDALGLGRAAAVANVSVKAAQVREVIAYLGTVADATPHEVCAACPSIPWPHTATTRMAEAATGGRTAVLLGAPLVRRTGSARPAPSGRLAATWALTAEGRDLAARLRETQP